MAKFAICSIEGCEKPVKNFRLGWCGMHIERDRRHGNPLTCLIEREPNCPHRPWGERKGSGGPLVERRRALLNFLKEVVLPCADDAGCIEWPFSFDAKGYGRARLDGKDILVYRYVCAKRHGPKPFEEAEAAHWCGNAKCVNPMHVRWTSRLGNVHDRRQHNGGHSFAHAKLTLAQVKEVRSSKEPQEVLAERLGVAQSTISKIKRGYRWKWAT